MPVGKIVFNLKPDNRQSPDRIQHMLKATPGIVLPSKATTSQWMGKIGNQLQKGSCTGQLGREYRDLMYRKLYIFEKSKAVSPDVFMSSADFVYLNNLAADGDLGNDAGSTIHQTFITLNKFGVCLEAQDPYSEVNVSVIPTSEQYIEALTYKGGPYHNVADLLTIKSCIASGYSVGGGINVYSSFMDTQLETTGFMPLPKPGELLEGGHAQHFLDYDDTLPFPDGCVGGVFTQNSWGSEWGISVPGRSDRGCYWIPYAYFDGTNVNDMWMMHLGPAW